MDLRTRRPSRRSRDMAARPDRPSLRDVHAGRGERRGLVDGGRPVDGGGTGHAGWSMACGRMPSGSSPRSWLQQATVGNIRVACARANGGGQRAPFWRGETHVSLPTRGRAPAWSSGMPAVTAVGCEGEPSASAPRSGHVTPPGDLKVEGGGGPSEGPSIFREPSCCSRREGRPSDRRIRRVTRRGSRLPATGLRRPPAPNESRRAQPGDRRRNSDIPPRTGRDAGSRAGCRSAWRC